MLEVGRAGHCSVSINSGDYPGKKSTSLGFSLPSYKMGFLYLFPEGVVRMR